MSDTFAARLRRLRDQAGLSVSQLAKKSGLHRQSIYKLEAGQIAPTLAAAVRLAHALGRRLSVWQGCV